MVVKKAVKKAFLKTVKENPYDGNEKDIDIQWVDINSIKSWEENPRKHSLAATKKLMKILDKYEQVTPVVVWRKNNVIYKGNGTYDALKRLKKTRIKVQFEDFPSEAAAIAYGIADNRASEFSKWDNETLLNLMTAEDMPNEIVSTGFSEHDLEGIMKKLERKTVGSTGVEPGSPSTTKDGTAPSLGPKKSIITICCLDSDREELISLLLDWHTKLTQEGMGFTSFTIE